MLMIENLMFLLKNLNTSEIQGVENTVQDRDYSFMDMSALLLFVSNIS